ncbi:MAG: lysine--tRNA ligase, partial [Burkholderiaceae bacterium]
MNDQPHDENHLIAERREKLTTLRKGTKAAFPNDVRPHNQARDLLERYDDQTRESLETLKQLVSIAGRMMLKRVH